MQSENFSFIVSESSQRMKTKQFVRKNDVPLNKFRYD